MVVAFIDRLSKGQIVEPPKLPHITIKKKFRLSDINEPELIRLLRFSKNLTRSLQLRLGDISDFDGNENKILQVMNPDVWRDLHHQVLRCLGNHIESRDHVLEGANYFPHVTWKLKGTVMLDPKPLCNTSHIITRMYLIKRLDPEIMQVKVVAVINMQIG